MKLFDTENWLLNELSQPAERTIERKALVLIDMLACNGSVDERTIAAIYRIAHAALGKCSGHEDWRADIIRQYRRHRREELRRRKQLLGGR
jgi:hypothetical protein